jgi:hypothetical protein
LPKSVPRLSDRPATRTKLTIRLARRRSPLILILFILCWSVILGWGLAQATTPPPNGTVDVVPSRYQLGQELYLENCATCHVGLPPAVMPSQTWVQLLPDSQHYGAEIPPINGPTLQIIWRYVSTYSRPTDKDEQIPYRLSQSRYFKALHPKVQFSQPVTIRNCGTCHPGASQFDFRSLTPEWQNAP